MKFHALEAFETEIRRERAEALGRTGQRLERALAELEAIRQELQGLLAADAPERLGGDEPDKVEIEANSAAYSRLWDHAKQLRYYLIIQREAAGLPRHDDVDRQYPLPRPLVLPCALPPGR